MSKVSMSEILMSISGKKARPLGSPVFSAGMRKSIEKSESEIDATILINRVKERRAGGVKLFHDLHSALRTSGWKWGIREAVKLDKYLKLPWEGAGSIYEAAFYENEEFVEHLMHEASVAGLSRSGSHKQVQIYQLRAAGNFGLIYNKVFGN